MRESVRECEGRDSFKRERGTLCREKRERVRGMSMRERVRGRVRGKTVLRVGRTLCREKRGTVRGMRESERESEGRDSFKRETVRYA